MKLLGPSMYGIMAAACTFLSTLIPGMTGAALLMIALILWLLFIVYILRALKPE